MFGNILGVHFNTTNGDWNGIFIYYSVITRNDGVNDLSIEAPDLVPLHHDNSP